MAKSDLAIHTPQTSIVERVAKSDLATLCYLTVLNNSSVLAIH